MLEVNRSNVFQENHSCNESENSCSMRAVTSKYLLCVFLGFLSVLIMCGNLLLIISITYFKQLHTPTNYLILSLAVADLLVGVVLLPFSAILAVRSCWYLLNLLCKVRSNFDIFLSATSILNLCLISVDRYYAVCQPLIYRAKINVRVVGIMIVISWSVPALNGISMTLLALKERQNNEGCVLFQNLRFAILATGLGFFLPVVIMCTVYMKIYVEAQRQARKIKCLTHQGKFGGTVSKKEKKATKTLAIILGVFLICWTPFILCTTFNNLSGFTIPAASITAFKCLGWSNSMLNPFVYAFFYSWFRTATRMIISGKIFLGDLTNTKLL